MYSTLAARQIHDTRLISQPMTKKPPVRADFVAMPAMLPVQIIFLLHLSQQ